MTQSNDQSTQQANDQGDVNPHQIAAMLFEGVLERIAIAKGHMQKEEVALKGEAISGTLEVLTLLRASLDMEKGGELADRLDSLYDYMERRLLLANLHNDQGMLDEVTNLLTPIRDAWMQIPTEFHQAESA